MGGAEEEVRRERLAQELLRAFGVRVDEVRGLLRESLGAQRVARPVLGGRGVGTLRGRAARRDEREEAKHRRLHRMILGSSRGQESSIPASAISLPLR